MLSLDVTDKSNAEVLATRELAAALQETLKPQANREPLRRWAFERGGAHNRLINTILKIWFNDILNREDHTLLRAVMMIRDMLEAVEKHMALLSRERK